MRGERTVGRRRPPVRAAGPAPELSCLDLAGLRAYRSAVIAEEDKVSYWRRLLQGRVDLLSAQVGVGHALDLAELVRVLGDTGSGRARRALMRVPAPVQLPDLPDLGELGELWEAHPRDAVEVADLIDRLQVRERALSDYRSALHARIDAATGELIVRYRADPAAALDLLPRE